MEGANRDGMNAYDALTACVECPSVVRGTESSAASASRHSAEASGPLMHPRVFTQVGLLPSPSVNPLVLAIVQGMATALGDRLLSRPRDTLNAVVVAELVESSKQTAEAAEASAAMMEQSMLLFLELLQRQDGFTLEPNPPNQASEVRRTTIVPAARSDGRGVGLSLLQLDREIKALRSRVSPRGSNPIAEPPPARGPQSFSLRELEREIRRQREELS